MTAVEPGQLHTLGDVERLMGTPRRTIFRALATGQLRSVRDHRYRIRVRHHDLVTWAALGQKDEAASS